MAHLCHAPGCRVAVPPERFACKPHWYALPRAIRDAIWREYRSGQEIDKRPSLRYLAVQRLACAHLAFRPHDEAAAIECMPYIIAALAYRSRAMAAGLGDPLAGFLTQAIPGEVQHG